MKKLRQFLKFDLEAFLEGKTLVALSTAQWKGDKGAILGTRVETVIMIDNTDYGAPDITNVYEKITVKIPKSTLAVVLICLVLVIGSAVWKCFWPSDLSKYLASQLSIQMVCTAGFAVAYFLKLADTKAVMRKVPWDMILTIGGMCMMINVLINCGITDAVGALMAEGNLPKAVIPALFLLMASVITLFANFTVIYPLLMPMVPVVAAATGCNSVTLFTALCLGSFTPGISPFSTGGACTLSGCPDEETRQKLVPKMFVMAIIIIVIICLLVMTPLVSFIPDCL